MIGGMPERSQLLSEGGRKVGINQDLQVVTTG